jgi:hypothetical protein
MDVLRLPTTDSNPSTSTSVESFSTAHTSNDASVAAKADPSFLSAHPLRKSSSVGPLPRGRIHQSAAPLPANDASTLGLERESIYDQDFGASSRAFQMPRRKQSLPGQLPLPSRFGSNVNAASRADNSLANAMNTTSTTSTRRLIATSLDSQIAPKMKIDTSTSAQPMAHGKNSAPSRSRTRSGSVGMNVSSPSSHLPFSLKTNISSAVSVSFDVAMPIETDDELLIKEPESQNIDSSAVNLLVLGSPGCGKASAIHKGCKAFRLGKASDITCFEGERSIQCMKAPTHCHQTQLSYLFRSDAYWYHSSCGRRTARSYQ